MSPSARDRLDSWKEIATYLQRDVRTLQRWERVEGLPVHRQLHQKRGSVYAYPAELDAWRDGRRAPVVAERQRVMLAVLPFANLSGQEDQDYFSDGLTEEMITHLGRSHPDELGVIARTSVMRYKATREDIGQIGRELGVHYVLEGSVRREDRKVRITGQLIRVSDQTHVWAESYDREMRDVLALQTEIARAVAREVGLKLNRSDRKEAAPPRSVDPVAYESYLKGRFHWYKLRPEHLQTALEYFEAALQKDPGCALAHVGISLVWFSRGDCGLVAPRDAFAKVKAAALRALELDDALAEAHEMVGLVRCGYEWDWRAAEAEFRRAIELNPSYADARLMRADLLVSTGRAEEAGAEMARCLELDPLNFFFRCFSGWHLLYAHRYDAAIAELHKTIEMEPQFTAAHLGLWGALHGKKKYAEALDEAATFFVLQGQRDVAEALSDGAGKRDYAGVMKRAAEVMVARSKASYVSAISVARVYAHAGERDHALDWLERAYEQRVTGLMHLAVAWDWHGLHAEPRFQDLLRRMNLPSPRA